MITADTITAEQIKALRAEALAAGDYVQVDACDLALSKTDGEVRTGDGKHVLATTPAEAREMCADAINGAK